MSTADTQVPKGCEGWDGTVAQVHEILIETHSICIPWDMLEAAYIIAFLQREAHFQDGGTVLMAVPAGHTQAAPIPHHTHRCSDPPLQTI